jgi:proteasome lid subunit RPN8/RPN11
MAASTKAKVVVSRLLVQNFTRRASRRYPNEYLESIFGRIRGETVYIHAFYPMDHTADTQGVAYEESEVEGAAETAEEERMEWIGTIHSHPEASAVPTPHDLLSAASDLERVMGICSIEKGLRTKIRVLFWPVTVPLGIEYR